MEKDCQRQYLLWGQDKDQGCNPGWESVQFKRGTECLPWAGPRWGIAEHRRTAESAPCPWAYHLRVRKDEKNKSFTNVTILNRTVWCTDYSHTSRGSTPVMEWLLSLWHRGRNSVHRKKEIVWICKRRSTPIWLAEQNKFYRNDWE